MNPLLGRWVSPDPLAVHVPSGDNPPDLNLYAYVKGQLLKAVDPIGLDKDYTEGRSTMISFAKLLPGGGEQHAAGGRAIDMSRGVGGVLQRMAHLLIAVHSHRRPKQPGQKKVTPYGSYDSSKRALYMETVLWHAVRDARVGSLTQIATVEGRRTLVHETFHGYEDLVLSQRSDYRALMRHSRDYYAKAVGKQHAEQYRAEAFAEYFAARTGAYMAAKEELERLSGQNRLTAQERNRIAATFNSTMEAHATSKGTFGYFTVGAGAQQKVPVAIDPAAKAYLDQLSGISDEFSQNEGLRYELSKP